MLYCVQYRKTMSTFENTALNALGSVRSALYFLNAPCIVLCVWISGVAVFIKYSAKFLLLGLHIFSMTKTRYEI